jgi:peptidoglycan/LPS O-acetylase OafA/YrhL
VGSQRRTVRLASCSLVALGAMSYSLYLLHGRIQFLVMQPFRQVLPADGIAFDLAVIAATSLICYGFHLMCERPFMYPCRRASPPHRGASSPDGRKAIPDPAEV